MARVLANAHRDARAEPRSPVDRTARPALLVFAGVLGAAWCCSSCWATTSGSSSTSGTSSSIGTSAVSTTCSDPTTSTGRRCRSSSTAGSTACSGSGRTCRTNWSASSLHLAVAVLLLVVMRRSRRQPVDRHRGGVAVRPVRRGEPGHRVGVPDGLERVADLRADPSAAGRPRRPDRSARLARPRGRRRRAALLRRRGHHGHRRRHRRAHASWVAAGAAPHRAARGRLPDLVARAWPATPTSTRRPDLGRSSMRFVGTGIGATFDSLGQLPGVGIAARRAPRRRARAGVGRASTFEELRDGRRCPGRCSSASVVFLVIAAFGRAIGVRSRLRTIRAATCTWWPRSRSLRSRSPLTRSCADGGSPLPVVAALLLVGIPGNIEAIDDYPRDEARDSRVGVRPTYDRPVGGARAREGCRVPEKAVIRQLDQPGSRSSCTAARSASRRRAWRTVPRLHEVRAGRGPAAHRAQSDRSACGSDPDDPEGRVELCEPAS